MPKATTSMLRHAPPGLAGSLLPSYGLPVSAAAA